MNRFIAWIKRFFEPTLDKALSQFHKAVDKLEAVQAHHDAQAAAHRQAAVQSTLAAQVSEQTASRAGTVKERMKDLVA